ncbi:dipeptidase PepE [Burkholderia cepacia]|uniref:dipeptidase PepE n=1 Tax=Burkholderia cepacia TaxID=292 RepID=UPI0009BCDDFF|nr:dipeptidase PepE [Burkholderia cepacia]
MDLLLLSNSRGPDGRYLAHGLEAIAKLAGNRRKAVFVPFAGVTTAPEDYTRNVQDALALAGINVTSVIAAGPADMQCRAVAEAELILVGGGNTFQLLKKCRENGLLQAIAAAVRAGTPYIGWSAGTNLACPTISTTNDMPIVDPGGFDALGLVDFQINPHYTNTLPQGHRGERRDQRIAEFLVAHPEGSVIGLPEGDWLQVDNGRTVLHGPFEAKRFISGGDVQTLRPGCTL